MWNCVNVLKIVLGFCCLVFSNYNRAKYLTAERNFSLMGRVIHKCEFGLVWTSTPNIMVVDAGDVFVGGRYHSLVPILR